MLIRSVEVTSYRVLGHVKIDLTRGFNVIHGENDTGKSTLMRAIKDVLTKRAKIGGATQREMLPRDGSTPEIAIEFEHGGGVYTVRKRFAAAKGTTRLVARFANEQSTDVSGEDAELALRAALGLGAGDGTRRREEIPGGIWPLLWIDQGTSNLAPELNDDTRLQLSERLRAISGSVLAGAGAESLFASARTEYRRWFTDTGKLATGGDARLFTAQQTQTEAKAERDRLAARLREHETSVDRHASLAREVDKLGLVIPDLLRAAVDAEKSAHAIGAHGAKLATAKAEAQAAAILAEQANARVEGRAAARAQIAEATSQAAALATKHREAMDLLARHDVARAELDVAARTAESNLATRDRAHALARAELDAIAARTALTNGESALGQARAQHDALVATRAKLATLAGADATATAIADHARAVERAELALEAAAAAIEVRALGDATIEIDGVAVAIPRGDAITRRADAPTIVRVPGVIEVRVTPGGKDVVRARADAETARAALRRALDAAGLRDVAEARARVDEKRALDGDASTKEQLLAILAPRGIVALETARAEQAARLAANEATLAALGATLAADASDDANAQARLDEAAHARDVARSAYDAARDHLSGHDLTRQRFDTDARIAERDAQAADRRVAELTTALDRAITEMGDDAALADARAKSVATHDASERAAGAIAAELARLHADDVEAAAKRARRAHDDAVQERGAKSTEMNVLYGELRSADLFGLHERLGAAESRVDEADAEVARLTENAEATRMLFEALSDARSTAQRAFVQPLQREITPLLQALFAEGSLSLDDRFGIEKVSRASYGDDVFDALGGGAREQLAILVRIGMASVLAGDDTLPVLLDDAIVFSSEERFARMMSVLARAARRLQIVLFTCHWERYRALGADNAIDLAALLRSGARNAT